MKSRISQSGKLSLGKKIGWAFMLLLAVYPILVSTGYLTMDPEEFRFIQQKEIYTAHMAILMVHIVASMLVIFIGPFQFLPGIRKGRWLKVHRWLGRTYLLGIPFGGLSGLYMAQFAYGGIISRLGFGALAILWLYTGLMAYRHIRNKRLEQHREWMTRNYAITFAAVMLRVWNPLFGGLGADPTTVYIAVAWLCWIPNLLVAEWIIRRNRRGQRRAASSELLRSPSSSR